MHTGHYVIVTRQALPRFNAEVQCVESQTVEKILKMSNRYDQPPAGFRCSPYGLGRCFPQGLDAPRRG
jgi:hypothetical protein